MGAEPSASSISALGALIVIPDTRSPGPATVVVPRFHEFVVPRFHELQFLEVTDLRKTNVLPMVTQSASQSPIHEVTGTSESPPACLACLVSSNHRKLLDTDKLQGGKGHPLLASKHLRWKPPRSFGRSACEAQWVPSTRNDR